LRAKILEMKAAGSDGFFIHAREGLVPPYLSAEWFAAVQTYIAVARELGLRAWLHYEMPYPRGEACGAGRWAPSEVALTSSKLTGAVRRSRSRDGRIPHDWVDA